MLSSSSPSSLMTPSKQHHGRGGTVWSRCRALVVLLALLVYAAYALTTLSRRSTPYTFEDPLHGVTPHSTSLAHIEMDVPVEDPEKVLQQPLEIGNDDEKEEENRKMRHYIAELEAALVRLGGSDTLKTLRARENANLTLPPTHNSNNELEKCLDGYDHTAHLLYDALSERGFEEYDCVEPPIIASNVDASDENHTRGEEEHIDRVEAWKPLLKNAQLPLTPSTPLCGCIHSARRRQRRLGPYANCSLSELNKASTLLHATTGAANREDDPIWIVFTGDSTVRQHVQALYGVSRLHPRATFHCERPQFPTTVRRDFNTTRWRATRYFNGEDEESRLFAKPYDSVHEYLRSPPSLLRLGEISEESLDRFFHDSDDNEMKGDFDVICTLKPTTTSPTTNATTKRGVRLVMSFRPNYGFSASRASSILRRPHTHRIIPTNTPRDETRTYYRHSLYPALDEPYFVEVPWILTRTMGDEEVRRLERRGCDLMVATSAIWIDTGMAWGEVEKRRCGFPLDSRDTAAHLHANRLFAFMGEACSLYGRKRFIWRTSNSVIKTWGADKVLMRNAQARAAARVRGVTLMDYEKLHEAHGWKFQNVVHTTNNVALDGLMQIFYYLIRTRREVYSERQMFTLQEIVRGITDPSIAPESAVTAFKKRRINTRGKDDWGFHDREGLEAWSVRESD